MNLEEQAKSRVLTAKYLLLNYIEQAEKGIMEWNDILYNLRWAFTPVDAVPTTYWTVDDLEELDLPDDFTLEEKIQLLCKLKSGLEEAAIRGGWDYIYTCAEDFIKDIRKTSEIR